MKPESLEHRLRKRAEIRRQIPGRKSVENKEPDRIADILEEAADEIKLLRETVEFYATGFNKKLTESMMGEYTPALVDRGARAQATLKQLENK